MPSEEENNVGGLQIYLCMKEGTTSTTSSVCHLEVPPTMCFIEGGLKIDKQREDSKCILSRKCILSTNDLQKVQKVQKVQKEC